MSTFSRCPSPSVLTPDVDPYREEEDGDRPAGVEERFEALRLCARTTPPPPGALQHALAEGLDWDRLTEEAAYHGVLPLLYHHAKRITLRRVPPDALQRMRTRVGARALHGTCLAQELDRLAGLFHEAAIPAIVVKGIPLAHDLYGGYALRPFGDTDLIIRRRDVDRLRVLLLAEGYTSASLGPVQRRLYLLVHAQHEFVNRAPALGGTVSVLDVHTALLPFGYSYREPFERLWERALPFPLDRHTVRVLQPADLLVVLCFHGFKNRWEALKYTADVAELVRAYPSLDWDVVRGRASEAKGLRVLYVALLLAAALLDAPVPAEVLETAQSDLPAVQMARRLIVRMPRQPYHRGDALPDRTRFNLVMQDAWTGRLRYGTYALVRRLAEHVLPA